MANVAEPAFVISDVIDTNIPNKWMKGNEIPNEFRDWVVTAAGEYKGFLKKVIMGPNWSKPYPFCSPEGFAAIISNDCPCISSIFTRSKMYASTCVLRLENAKTRNGTPFTVEYVEKEKVAIGNTLNKYIPQAVKYPASLGYFNSRTGSDNPVDKQDYSWTSSLGGGDAYCGGSSFAGIYYSNRREKENHVNDLWIGLSSICDKLSNDLMDYMDEKYTADCVKEGSQISSDNYKGLKGKYTTMHKFFFEDPNVSYIFKTSERNRERLLWNVCDVLNLDLNKSLVLTDKRDYMAKSSSNYPVPGYVKPTCCTVTNMAFSDGPADIVYYSQCVDIRRLKRGSIICESPLLGLNIVKGVTTDTDFIGEFNPIIKNLDRKVIERVNELKGIFPVNTQAPNPQPDTKKSKNDKIPQSQTGNVIVRWEGDNEIKQNRRLIPGFYRKIDPNFERSMRLQGWGYEQGCIQLFPIVVKISVDAPISL